MGFDEGRIVLDSPNGAYYSGQTVHGKLIFQQEKVKTFRGIYVKLKGFCKVHWTTTEYRTINGRRHAHTVNHDSYEEYIHTKVYLVGGESGEHQIQPGNYEYPFTFHLPAGCPSSFEGDYGHVRYTIKAVVDRSFKFDQEKKVAVRLMCPLDLNANPSCREPIEMEFNAVYCCCCMRSGATDTVINVPVSGFCPGQTMAIEVACNNKGSVEVDSIKLIISKKVTFIATSRPGERSNKDTIAEIKKGSVPADTTRNYTVELDIPALDVYNLSGCRYIDIDYKFKVIVSPSGCHSDSEGSRYIIIGTIPLVGYQDNVQNPLHDQMPQQTATVTQQAIPTYNINPPYPSGSPYPNQNAPYPVSSSYPTNDAIKSPYPTANAPYPTGNTSYSDNPPPYPGNTSFPMENQSTQKLPYPTGISPYPTGNAPYPTGNSPYPTGNTPYPTGNSPNPTQNTPYPTENSPYPARNAPYPTGNSPNPTQNTLYLPEKSPYPTENSPYPTGNAPYPTGNSNPTENTPYPTEDSPYPAGSLPYPTGNTPYPTANSPYPPSSQSAPGPASNVFGGSLLKTGTIGFTVAGSGVPNPIPPVPVNPYVSASAPALDSPDTEKKEKE